MLRIRNLPITRSATLSATAYYRYTLSTIEFVLPSKVVRDTKQRKITLGITENAVFLRILDLLRYFILSFSLKNTSNISKSDL